MGRPTSPDAGPGRGARTILAGWAGRTAAFLLKAAGRPATTLPGRIALRIQPGMLRYLASGRRIAVITGTNGKTTSARLLTGILSAGGEPVTDNPAGANLASGLVTALLLDGGGSKTAGAYAVLEVDEAALARTAADLAPEVCIVTNIFRDQLDRYGERDYMRSLIAKGLGAAAGARAQKGMTLVVCADDPFCDSLADPFVSNPDVLVERTGLDVALMEPVTEEDASPDEAAACPDCGTAYRYTARSYGHLGAYHCPSCGRSRPEPTLTLHPEGNRSTGTATLTPTSGPACRMSLDVPGIHNLYNAAGAVAGARALGIPFETSCARVQQISAAFGRMERMELRGKPVWMILVKNPVGMDRILDHVGQASDVGGLYLLLNAEIADGRDTSWIWDAHQEGARWPDRVYVSGRRVWDMALRLQYAGVAPERIHADKDAGRLLEQALDDLPEGKALYILPNYTAMLGLRSGPLGKYGVDVFGRGQS